MATTVLFTGAGASKPFDFPLTYEILPLIRQQIKSGELFLGFKHRREDADTLDGFLKQLLPGYDEVESLPNITDVLSLIDHALLTSVNPLKECRIDDLVRFRVLVEKAIYDVLWPPYKDYATPYNENPPPLLLELGDRLAGMVKNGQTVNLITTNYDTAIETQLYRHFPEDIRLRFDFGFSWRDPKCGDTGLIVRPANPSVRIYKLHGSVNWLRCERCEHTYVNPRGHIGGHGFSREQKPDNTCHCDCWPLRPVLVTPSLIRNVRDVNLLEVWKHTLELLRVADHWLIVGYSLPAEDVAIRSLFVRAYHGRGTPPRVTVIQNSDNPEMRDRFRVFFPKCEFFTDGFERFIPRIGS